MVKTPKALTRPSPARPPPLPADPQCKGSIKSISVNGRPGKAFLWVDHLGPSALLKISNLKWDARMAVGSEICYTLRPPVSLVLLSDAWCCPISLCRHRGLPGGGPCVMGPCVGCWGLPG